MTVLATDARQSIAGSKQPSALFYGACGPEIAGRCRMWAIGLLAYAAGGGAGGA